MYAVIGFGAASMLGMPGQSIQVALAFWTLAFWVILLREPDSPQATDSGNRNGRSSWPLAAALGLAATLAASTLLAGMRDMRPPFRAKGFDQGFRYGLHQPHPGHCWHDAYHGARRRSSAGPHEMDEADRLGRASGRR